MQGTTCRMPHQRRHLDVINLLSPQTHVQLVGAGGCVWGGGGVRVSFCGEQNGPWQPAIGTMCIWQRSAPELLLITGPDPWSAGPQNFPP